MLSNEATLYAGGLNSLKNLQFFHQRLRQNNNILCCFANLNNFLCQIKGVSPIFYKDYEVFFIPNTFFVIDRKISFFEFRVIFSA